MSHYFGCIKLALLLSAPLAIVQCFQISQDRTTCLKLEINILESGLNITKVKQWWSGFFQSINCLFLSLLGIHCNFLLFWLFDRGFLFVLECCWTVWSCSAPRSIFFKATLSYKMVARDKICVFIPKKHAWCNFIWRIMLIWVSEK